MINLNEKNPQVDHRPLSVCGVQDQYETVLSGLQQRREELETKLKGVQMVLQEKVQQLKEQVSPPAAVHSPVATHFL